MKFDKINETFSKRKENKTGISAQIIENAEVTSDISTVSIDTVDDYTDKDGEQPFSIDQEKINAIADSIRINGQLEPLIVRESKDIPGHYQLLAGHHRKRAMIQNGDTACNIKVIDVNDWQAYCIVCETNIHHSGPLPSQLCKIFRRYRDHSAEESITAHQLSQMYGISTAQMYRYIAMDKLIPGLQELVDKGLISSNSIKPLSSLTKGEQKRAADYINYLGKKLSPGKCKKLIDFLKGSLDVTNEEIDEYLDGEKTQNTNYRFLISMDVDALSLFLFEHLNEFTSSKDILDFLNKEHG